MKVIDIKQSEEGNIQGMTLEMGERDVWFFHDFNLAVNRYMNQLAREKQQDANPVEEAVQPKKRRGRKPKEE